MRKTGAVASKPTYRGLTAEQLPSGWLADALDGLHAYDGGALDSGVHDEELRAFCKAYLATFDRNARRVILSRIMRQLYLEEDRLAQGYGWEDARDFGDWLDEQFGVA